MNTRNLAYADEIYYELIDGETVMMTPRPAVNHTLISGNIHTIFNVFLKGKSCIPFGDGVDLYLSEDNRFVPDGMIVCDRDKIKTRGIYGAPDLVIEVLSPSTAKNDRGKKKDAYEKAEVLEYWIVDPEIRTVEVYILEESKYILDNIYRMFSQNMLEDMTDEEKDNIITEFKCSLFDELVIKLDDIFKNLF